MEHSLIPYVQSQIPATLYLFRYNLKIGYGLVAKTVNGHRYLYFWYYRNSGGRSRKVEKYIGPVNSPRTNEKAIRMLLEHQERSRVEMDARAARFRRALIKFV